ncbi:hypothetical protein FA13DRAFT_1714936 [Coprinellus micaceus]|uniref:Uncharacterized protein n=1 Tax=Coprinellus micaceus TaxID=71717 RepID=A0A4Y7SQ60_COPMI|nr:hypothetical protein FA13DRAFT_1714936 [Coprinellus micaceus]
MPRRRSSSSPVRTLTWSDLAHSTQSINEAEMLQHEVDTLVQTESRLRIELTNAEEDLLHNSDLSPPQKVLLLAALRARLRAAEEQLLLCNSALSPIRKLPHEILGEIFNTLLYMVSEEEKRTTLKSLSQVCKAWNPPLHDPIHWAGTTLRLKDKKSVRTFMDIEARFKGAGDLPRTVVLEGDGCSCGDPAERWQWRYCDCPWRVAVTKLLCQSSPIRHLSLRQWSFRCFTNLMASLDEASEMTGSPSWLLIQSMELELWSIGARGLAAVDEEGDLTSPSRKKVILNFLDLPSSLTSLSLKLPPWPASFKTSLVLEAETLNNLASLSICCDWDTTDVLRALRDCQNLQSLVLDLNKSPQSWKCSVQQIVLPLLRSLDITIRNYCAASRILPLLVLPQLVDLRLFVDFTHDDRELERRLAYLNIISPPALSLRSLTIHSSTFVGLKRKINPEVLISIFFSIPSLRHFTLDTIFFDPKAFTQGLRKRLESDADFLPLVQSMRLIDVDGGLDVFDINTFLHFVTLRRSYLQREGLQRVTPCQPDSLRTILFYGGPFGEKVNAQN